MGRGSPNVSVMQLSPVRTQEDPVDHVLWIRTPPQHFIHAELKSVRMKRFIQNILILSIGAFATMPADVGLAQVTLEPAFSSLTFDTPVDIQVAPGEPDRLYVVEQRGVVKLVLNDPDATTADVFLDISARVYTGMEEGLLGLAFHPHYDENGRFFVYYNVRDPLRARLSSFTSDRSDRPVADPFTEEILLEIDQPFDSHNGGQIRFGPDGYLYISVGDGGGHGENLGTGDDLKTLLGSILRVDVDNADDGKAYAIPAENPFARNREGYRKEIFAFGFRNPWRFSFDRKDFEAAADSQYIRIWTADVGAGSFEEIDIVERGKNYGWNEMEGFRCLALATDCDTDRRMLPVWEYEHHLGRAVIGGFVYRGSELPFLEGKYVYGDYLSGRIWALTHEADQEAQNEELLHADSLRIFTFGEDARGELLIGASNGDESTLYRLLPSMISPAVENGTLPEIITNVSNSPNPFHTETVITYSVASPEHITLSIYNALGQRVRNLVDAMQLPGRADVIWDGTDERGATVPSGVYVYRISAEGAAATSGQIVFVR